jgi:hypothetical protein
MQTQKNPLKWWRVFFSIAYLAIAAGIIYFRRHEMFYIEPQVGSYQLDRFLWCLSASFIGFSVLVFQLWRHQESTFPTYITYYPAMLAVISALVFSISHLFVASSGFVFYYLSFAACFILAFSVDSFWGYTLSIVKKGAG